MKKKEKKIDLHCFAYPTALKRQLLSEGITLLTTTPSMEKIVDNHQPENQPRKKEIENPESSTECKLHYLYFTNTNRERTKPRVY